MTAEIETLCRDEVIALHWFFEVWFNGAIKETDENFSRFDKRLSATFTLISPDGRVSRRETLVSNLRSAYGSHQNDDLPFRIWIENVVVRPLNEEFTLLTYEEWQEIKGGTTARISTAVFRSRSGPANPLEWLHVHETWLDEEGDHRTIS